MLRWITPASARSARIATGEIYPGLPAAPVHERRDSTEARAVVYLTVRFPVLSEPYVIEEIEALRARGVRVVVFAARRPARDECWLEKGAYADECIYLSRIRLRPLLQSMLTCVLSARRLWPICARILFRGSEGPALRLKGLVKIWLGVYLAQLVRPHAPAHIHVHHGYYTAMLAMVAASLTGITYSVTFHGSDLLLAGKYLDMKVGSAKFVVTISDYNKQFLLRLMPATDPAKVFVRRLGVAPAGELAKRDSVHAPGPRVVLSVGRLHPVKNQEFLIRACRGLEDLKVDFLCLIVGSGPREQSLTTLIRSLGLVERVKLVGAVPPSQMPRFYALADVCVLTSTSEGIPLVLMEAMHHGVPVLAPRITGVPELVIDGKTGFLYEPNDLRDLTDHLRWILTMGGQVEALRATAYRHVRTHYDARRNVELVADLMISMVHPGRSAAAGPVPR